MFLHAFESNTAKALLSERAANGPFKSLDDFIERVPVGMEQLAILIKIDAFRFTGVNKRELLWEAHMKLGKTVVAEPMPSLFKAEKVNYQTPELSTTVLEDAFDQMELLGFPLCSPFFLLLNPGGNTLRARQLMAYISKTITIEGYLVTTKRTNTTGGKGMFFGNFLDRDGDFIDTVHFPPVAKRYPFRGKGIYRITGVVMEEFGCVSVEVSRMERLPIIADPRYADSKKGLRI